MAILETDLDEQGQIGCAKLKVLLVNAINAEQSAIQGQSYIWGDRSVTYQDVGEIRRYIKTIKSDIKSRCQTNADGKLKKPKSYTGFYRGIYYR